MINFVIFCKFELIIELFFSLSDTLLYVTHLIVGSVLIRLVSLSVLAFCFILFAHCSYALLYQHLIVDMNDCHHEVSICIILELPFFFTLSIDFHSMTLSV